MDERDTRHRVSCILPAFNEAGSVGETVEEWAAMLERCTRDYEIIVVDDGSADGTSGLLDDLSARFARLRVITHRQNLGYGAAIAHGFAQAVYPLLFFTDADGQYDPEDFRLLLERIDAVDIVVGYRARRAEGGGRRLLSLGYNGLVRRVIGVSLRDINCAFKLMHRDAYRKLGIESTGFAVNAELAVRAREVGMTVREVPVRHRPRSAGRSTVRPSHVVYGLCGLAWLRLRRGPMAGSRPSVPATTAGSPLGLEKPRSPHRPAG